MASFFDMGGYAVYVWPAYLSAALILGVLVAVSLHRLRAQTDELRRLERKLGPEGGRRPRPPAI